MGLLLEDLQQPGMEFKETHISRVLIGAREVWKLKKPVSLGFLDFSTSEKRRAACEAEVVLNRRLAPEAYLGVIPVTRDDQGRHAFAGKGEVVDWAVLMRRLPESHRLDRRLASGRLDDSQLEALAVKLANFHAEARCDAHTAQFGTIEAIAYNVRENFDQVREKLPLIRSQPEAHALEELQNSFLNRHAALFAERIQRGRVRDGHGDLRLGQIYLDDDGDATILDCIEFNERFRFGDVAGDVGFLSMDLAAHGYPRQAEILLAAYAQAAQDFDLYRLIDFYQSYRACVRGKVALLTAADTDIPAEARSRAEEEARRYYHLALSFLQRSPPTPVLVTVGGLIASGKSTVAAGLGRKMAAPVISSDRTRKFLWGTAPTQPLSEEGYSFDATEQVYREVFRLAQTVLSTGRPVIIDATFRARSQRRAARDLALSLKVPFLFIECRADTKTLRRRLKERVGRTGVSDAREELLDGFMQGWEPVEETGDLEHLILDTDSPPEETQSRLREYFPDRLGSGK